MSTIHLTPADLHHALALRDLSDRAQGPHAMQILLGRVVSALTSAWACTTATIRNPPIVAVRDNDDRLGVDAGDLTRDSRYTRYIRPTTMLRSHTSADIPHTLERYRARPGPVDELIVFPDRLSPRCRRPHARR